MLQETNNTHRSRPGLYLAKHRGMLVSGLLAVLLFSQAGFAVGSTSREEKIIVMLRYDDYSSVSSTEMELKLIGALQRHNVSCAFGVIPNVVAGDIHDLTPQNTLPLNPRKAGILKKAIASGSVEVGLHGYSHQTITKEGFSEFRGLAYNAQTERIAAGRKLLEEMLATPVTTFFPPWNSYDLNTIKALESSRFTCLSACMPGDADETSSLKFLPYTSDIPGLKEAVLSARRLSDTQPIIMVLFHDYDFLEVDRRRGVITYPEFEALLDWLTSQDDIDVMSLSQAHNTISDLTVSRFINNRKRFSVSSPDFVPLFLRGTPREIYLSDGNFDISFKKALAIWMPIASFFLALVFLPAAIVSSVYFFVYRESRFLASFARWSVPLLLAGFLIFAFHDDLLLGRKEALVVTVLLGLTLGVWGRHFRLAADR